MGSTEQRAIAAFVPSDGTLSRFAGFVRKTQGRALVPRANPGLADGTPLALPTRAVRPPKKCDGNMAILSRIMICEFVLGSFPKT